MKQHEENIQGDDEVKGQISWERNDDQTETIGNKKHSRLETLTDLGMPSLTKKITRTYWIKIVTNKQTSSGEYDETKRSC